jgi:hypothetical protein
MNQWPGTMKGLLLLTAGLCATVSLAEDSAVTEAEPAVTEQTLPRASADQLLLDRTSIRGSQELPRVLYIVPWKDSRLGNIIGRPVNSLIDEVLAPVDRDVFLRQTKYFDQLYGSGDSGNGK